MFTVWFGNDIEFEDELKLALYEDFSKNLEHIERIIAGVSFQICYATLFSEDWRSPIVTHPLLT